MPTTPLGFPYFVGSDVPAGMDQQRQLAQAVDTYLSQVRAWTETRTVDAGVTVAAWGVITTITISGARPGPYRMDAVNAFSSATTGPVVSRITVNGASTSANPPRDSISAPSTYVTSPVIGFYVLAAAGTMVINAEISSGTVPLTVHAGSQLVVQYVGP
jgi:hypothetical protein